MSITPASASLRLGALAMVLVCGLAASPSFAQVRPPEEGYHKAPNADYGPGLPFFDARLDADGVPLAQVTAHVDALKKSAAWSAREADAARLRAMVDGLAIDNDPLMGTARFVRSTWKFLTPPKMAPDQWSPIGVVKNFMVAYPALMEGAAAEIDSARVERDLLTDHNGARHLTLVQQIRGIDLFESGIQASVTRNGELINLQNTMLPRPVGDFVTPAIWFDGRAAIIIAAANVGIQLSSDPVAATDPAGANMKQEWAKHPDLRPDEKVITELVYFALDRDTIHPAWHVIVPVKGVGHTYDMHVDAVDGSILRRHDWLVWDTTQPVTMRVYPSDGVAPGSPGNLTNTGFQFPVVPRQLITWNPADVSAFSPNGWINDGNTQTVGNNVDAHTDLNADNIADLPRPDGGASRVFDFPFDPAVEPATQQQAVVTELFFRTNWYHDKLMVLGFNEAARNFQTTNFSGSGTGGDAVQADAQDGSGTNNANFGTSSTDGSTGRCQMFLFTGPTPDRDGSFDGDIVYHELTHGTSIRLHTLGLSGTQCGGLGEGWSDFVGMLLLAEPADDPDAVYCTGGYTTYQLGSTSFTSNYYFGIRRYPYCTNMLKSPLTYKDIATAQAIDHQAAAGIPRSTAIGNTANEVHNIGEYWCATLLESRASFVHTYGFAGNQRMLQLVIDAMKMDPGNPTLIQSRDAILAADNADFGGVDVPALWTAFAKRGLGFSATSPASSTTTGVLEAYDTPNFATFTYPDGLPTQLSPTTPVTFRVNIAGTGLSLTPGSGQMFLSLNGGAYAPIALTVVGTNQYTATIPAQSCLTRANFYFSTGTSIGAKTDPTTAPTANYASLTYTAASTPANDGFETDLGWTTGTGLGDTATTGQWIRAVPVSSAAQTGAAHGGTLCWVTGNAAAGAAVGTNDVDGGFTTLISPAFNLSGLTDATVSYWRWYYNSGSTNTGRIDVSVNNGTNWTRAETLGPGSTTETGGGWRHASWTFSSLGLTPSAQVKIRYIVEDLTGTIVEGALDDFRIDAFSCTAATITGACCAFPSGSCSVATQSACVGTAGSTYQGDATTCAPIPCVPGGACCAFPSGSCSVATQAACIAVSGSTYQGNASTCTPSPCFPSGACCTAPSGACSVATSSACTTGGGTYQGDATACIPTNPCSPTNYTVTITKSGTGHGTVSGSAGGINCGVTCSGSVAFGTNLTLTATPDAVSAFIGWTGSCAGTGLCNQTISGPITADAQFNCKADFNGAGGITVADIFDFLAAWFSGSPAADFNGVNGINVQDIFDFLAAWFVGCP